MNLKCLVGVLALSLPTAALAQISFDYSSSSWGASGTFAGSGTAGQTVSATPGYYSATNGAGGFTFGFTNSASPSATADYDLSSTVLTAGTSLSLVFTGLSEAPSYVAMTGGNLTAYSYNSGTLSLTASTIDPVASASDTTGSTLGSAFGLLWEYGGGSNDLSGTVFQTDMFWDDIASMPDGYSGDTPIAGINANGQNGTSATFIAHLSVAFLQANGINSPNDCVALVQKVGGSYSITIVRELHASSNTFGDEGYTYIGTSDFDLDGGGDDDYVKATYSNSVWSDGNIGITSAVPEPSTYALILGALSLVGIVVHRRRRA